MYSFSDEKLSANNDIVKINPTSPRYISQNDFIYFKNELLKDLKTIENKLNLKMDSSKREYENKFINVENKLDSLKSKMLENNSSGKDLDKNLSEKFNKLFFFKTSIEDKIFIHEKKLKEISDYSRESLYEMNKLIQDNLLCPGIIGNNSKFQTFQNLIDYLLSNINLLNAFKEKIVILDIQNYKSKLDRLAQSFKLQIDNFILSSKKLTTDTIITFDKKATDLYNTFENKLIEEKNDLEIKLNKTYEKIEEQNQLIYDNKNDLINTINKIVLENNETFNEINLKYEKYINEIGDINKKCDELAEKNRKIGKDLEEKLKDNEHKLIVKMSHLYTMIKDFNVEFNKKLKSLNSEGLQFNNLNLDKFFENNLNIIKNNEPDIPNIQLKSSHSVGSLLKKYIDGEIGLNEFLHSARDKKRKTTRINNNVSNEVNESDSNNINNINNTNNINNLNNLNKNINNNINNNNNFIFNNYNNYKDIINNDNNISFQNIKYNKLDNKNEIMKNNQDNYKNNKFTNKNLIDKAIIDNENNMLNKTSRKDIVRNLLMGNIDPFTYYLMKSKYEKKNGRIIFKNNINSNTPRINKPFLPKGKSELTLLSKGRFRNNSSYHFKKKGLPNVLFNSGEDVKHLSNEEINNYQDSNKRTISSLNDRSRNLDKNSYIVHNNTDIVKDNSKLYKNSTPKANIENKHFKKIKINKNVSSPEAKIYNINFKNNFSLNTNKKKVNKNIKIVKNDSNYKWGIIKKDKIIKSGFNHFNSNKINKDK